MVATAAAAAEAAAALKAAQVQAALDAEINMKTASASSSSRVVKGVYVHGNVGTGKTLLMDTFFEACPLPDDKKRRVHFHQFLLEIHARIRAFKLGLIEKHGRDLDLNVPSERDAIEQVALQVSQEAWLLCFDEFQVTDVADALILRRFFDVLWDQGTILVATSNRPPVDLYKNGINRAYFEPFIERLQKQTVVKDISSSIDYRSLKFLAIGNDVYDYRMSNTDAEPSSPTSHMNTSNTKVPFSVVISIMMGRSMVAEITGQSGASRGVGWFDFSFLCEQDRGAADFQAICRSFDTVFLDNVPVLSVLEHDKARRFIVLVDTLYDNHTRLYWAAAAPPKDLFQLLKSSIQIHRKGEGKGKGHEGNVDEDADELLLMEGELASVQELSFAFRRAASRLTEMAGSEYHRKWAERGSD
eukprot:GSChrysophyteH2.ASY1.ANO1.1719.1 assembled CDS